jgi:hypothetical protein
MNFIERDGFPRGGGNGDVPKVDGIESSAKQTDVHAGKGREDTGACGPLVPGVKTERVVRKTNLPRT